MAEPEVGKLWVPESAEVILDDLLTDVRLSMYQQGVTLPVTPGTDTYITMAAVANAAMMQYSQLPGIAKAANPLYAVGKDLDDWRKWLGLPVVSASPSSGAIRLKVTGTGSVPAGTQLVLPNGKRIQVSGSHLTVIDGEEIPVIGYDTGKATNAPRGTKVRFVSAPLNVDPEATVSYELPLSGGVDAENDERKRTRVLNRLAFAASKAACNWAGLRGMALDALASVQDAFVYPALGGPSSAKTVPVRGFDRDNFDFKRAFSSAAMALIRSYIQSNAPDANQYVVQAPSETALSVAIGVTIPNSRMSGGNGSGWVDSVIWPSSVTTRVLITAFSATAPQITVDAATSTAPVSGQTHIMWWSRYCMKFYRRTVVYSGGSSGAWVLTLDAPLVDDLGNGPVVNDQISPAAERADAYAKSWLDIVEKLGPGENISASVDAPRDSRRPFISDGPRSGVTTAELLEFQRRNVEITDLEYTYVNSTTPAVPATIDLPPAIFVPLKLGVYQQ